MMKQFLKVILLVIAMVPVWLTIVALGEPVAPVATIMKEPSEEVLLRQWKDKINSQLLLTKDRRIQMLEILPPYKNLLTAQTDQNFELDLSEIRSRGNSVVGLRYLDEEGRLTAFYRVICRLLIQEQVAVATRDLARDSVIKAGDFKMDWRDASSFSSITAKANDLIGKVIRNQVRENDIIFEAGLQKENLINRGDRVKVSVVGRGLTLTTVGIAQEAGIRGQTIKIQNTDSKKDIIGVVTNSREVEVRL
jgi:flagella basal body P-ring formation protein FlgA